MQNPVLKNVSSGQIIELVKSPFTIGRSLTSDYVIENKIVSRIHCSLTKTEEGWTLTDSSTNGTLVNDGHYKGETSPFLKHNDEISLGYDSYTYRFLTEVEKAPNCQIERLRSEESNVQGNTTLNEQSPSTPNSFDENGISDDFLNDLADNMLTTVEQPSNNKTSIEADIPLEKLEQGTTSKNTVTSKQPEKEEEISNTPKCNIVTSIPLEPTTVVNQLNTWEKDLGQVASTNNVGTSKQVENKNEESKKQNDNSDGSSNNSASTVIYSLPDEILSEMALPVNDNREEQASNMNVEQNKDTEAVLVHIGSIGAVSTAENNCVSGPSTSACKPRDLLAESKFSNKNVEQNKSTVAVEMPGGSIRGKVEDISVSGPSPSTSKPRDLLAESIEAVVRNYSDVTTVATTTASTSGQIAQARLVSNSSNTMSSIQVPTSVTMASPMNSNKKVKVMSGSSGNVNQLRPLSSAEVASMIATGQQVKRITRDEMKRILAIQPGVPMVVLDQDATNPSSITPNTTGHQLGTSASTPRVSVSTSTKVSTTSTLSSSSPVKVTVLRGVRKLHNTSLPARITKTLQNYEQTNVTSTASPNMSAFSVVFNLLQTAKNTSAITNNTMLHNVETQNNTTVMSGNSLLQPSENPSTGGNVLKAGNPSTTISTDGMVVPVAPPVNTVESTGHAGSTVTNQNIPAIKCQDSQEPGTSKAPEKVVSDSLKQNQQNQYEEMENELMCTICANLFIKAVTLGCSHSFCQYCIGQWKKKKTDCPICRNQITSTTRTLVLDNIIEKMAETASDEDKAERKAAIEERKKMEEEEIAKKNQQNVNKNNGRGRNTARRGRRVNANTRSHQQQHNTANNVAPPDPVITIADSPSTTDSDNDSSDNSDNNSDNSAYDYDEYYSDDWYNGRRGAYYGGYGSCYKCGDRGHWANGCPYR